MSQKINSKNLSYDNSLPPFLAAMRAEVGSGGAGHQPPTIGQRVLGKKRSGSEEAEDAPVVVDEDGNVVSVDIGTDGSVRQKGDGADDEASEDKGAETKNDGAGDAPTKSATAIGARKRKVGKVVGDAAEDLPKDEATKTTKEDREDAPKEKKVKKKAKKIKLSFDEEDG